MSTNAVATRFTTSGIGTRRGAVLGGRRPRSVFAGVTVAALALGGVVLTTGPASAAPTSCPVGWTPVGSTACELVVKTSGPVTLPSGVNVYDVLAVGGGGGGGGGASGQLPQGWGAAGGGGGGGEVVVCTRMTDATLDVTIGDGGSTGIPLAGWHLAPPNPRWDGGPGLPTIAGTCVAGPGAGGYGAGADVVKNSLMGTGGASGTGLLGGTAFWRSCAPTGCTASVQSGGGGGAGRAGLSGDFLGPGGAGMVPTAGLFVGNTAAYGGGGGGGGEARGDGGAGGGGRGGSRTGGPADHPMIFADRGAANTGGGGGGGVAMVFGQPPSTVSGGAPGGSGVVVIRFALNRPPVALPDGGVMQAGLTNAIDVLANDTDPDLDSLTVTAATQGSKGTVAFTSTGVTYTPTASATGTDTFTYTVSDGAATSIGTVTVTFNHAPLAANDTAAVRGGSSVTVDVLTNDSDPDADPVSITSATQGSKGTVAFTTTDVTYTPSSGTTGTDTFTYTISDGRDRTATATVTVKITNAPVAVADIATVSSDTATAIDVLANDSDLDKDPLSVTAVTQGSKGVVAFTATGVTYTPTPGATGSDTFTYTISDGAGGTATATVTVTINAPTPTTTPTTTTTPAPTTTPTTAPGPGEGTLPATGVVLSPVVGAGGALAMLLGLGMVIGSRRRRV